MDKFEVIILNPPGRYRYGWAEVRTKNSFQVVKYCLNDTTIDLLEKAIHIKRSSFIDQVINLLKRVI